MFLRALGRFVETEVSILSRRYNAYFLGGSAEVTTSQRTAIDALDGDIAAKDRERRINWFFRVYRNEDNHCRNVLIDDVRRAQDLLEKLKELRAEGKL